LCVCLLQLPVYIEYKYSIYQKYEAYRTCARGGDSSLVSLSPVLFRILKCLETGFIDSPALSVTGQPFFIDGADVRVCGI